MPSVVFGVSMSFSIGSPCIRCAAVVLRKCRTATSSRPQGVREAQALRWLAPLAAPQNDPENVRLDPPGTGCVPIQIGRRVMSSARCRCGTSTPMPMPAVVPAITSVGK